MAEAGSSRIPKVSSIIVTGEFIGPVGPTGPTGNQGPTVVGQTGASGRYITNIEGISADSIRIYFNSYPWSDISQINGPTGSSTIIGDFSVGFTGVTTDAYYLISSGDGITLFFKSIELVGEITAAYTSTDLIITGKTSEYSGSFVPGSLLYIGATSSSDFYILTSAVNSKYSENYISGITYSSFESLLYGFYEENSSKNFNYSLNSTRDDSGLTLFVNTSFYGVTFDVISDEDLSSNSTPFLKYSLNYSGVCASGFISSIISFSKKQNYNKTIGSNTNAPLNELIGSCCYCDTDGNRFCNDYVNKTYCTGMLSGTWSSIPCYLRYNTDDCYAGGACCVNNKCVSCSQQKCLSMGGLFVPGENCSSIGTCPSPCDPVGCCCVNGTSYSLTESLCSEIEGSRFFSESCSEVNCCVVGYLGACCIRKVCYDYFSARECGETGGVFQGPGSACISQFINCCTDPTLG